MTVFFFFFFFKIYLLLVKLWMAFTCRWTVKNWDTFLLLKLYFDLVFDVFQSHFAFAVEISNTKERQRKDSKFLEFHNIERYFGKHRFYCIIEASVALLLMIWNCRYININACWVADIVCLAFKLFRGENELENINTGRKTQLSSGGMCVNPIWFSPIK